jgi:hypothetical protein
MLAVVVQVLELPRDGTAVLANIAMAINPTKTSARIENVFTVARNTATSLRTAGRRARIRVVPTVLVGPPISPSVACETDSETPQQGEVNRVPSSVVSENCKEYVNSFVIQTRSLR